MAAAPGADDFATWDAVETRRRVRARDVTPREVVERAIARAEAISELGAVVTPSFERALEHARGEDRGELFGVPTFIKDLAPTAGVRTTWGSAGSGHYVPKRSIDVVKRFEAMGLVSLGKSATPELGMTATTEPVAGSPCRNPWNPQRSTGGSSGGAACLVAAGVVPVAHASDGGGSIRIPAACCGLVGLKPSRGRLDMEGSNLLPLNVACDGVVSRTVRDTIAFWEALESGRAPKRLQRIGSVGPRRTPLKIGLFVEAPSRTPVDPDVCAAVLSTGRVCRDLGHEVEEIACPFDRTLMDDFLRYWGMLAWLQVRSARVTLHWGFDAGKLDPWTLGLAGWFASEMGAGFAAMRRLRAFSRSFPQIIDAWDVLLSPTLAEPAPLLGHLAPNQPFETAFARLRAWAQFTPLYNAAGAPAISLPLARSSAGLPIGVQLASVPGRDRTLLELSLALEEARPWPRIAPAPPA